jgi:hypothetical protein
MRLPVSHALTGLLLVILCAPAVADEPTTKPTVPNAASLRKATAQVDQQYREDVAKARDPEAKAALAKKILDAAKDEEKPDVKYTLLNKAMQSAITAGDAQAASDAVDQIEASWQLDAAKLRSETLVKTARLLRTTDDQSSFVRLVSPVVDKMVADKKFDPAKSLNDAALSAAQKAGDSAAVKDLTARGAEIVERRTAESRVAYATNVLKTRPNDPVANTAVGKYQCYIDDNWAEGLIKLQRGNDSALKGIADKELAQDATPEAKNAAADGWWDLARHESELARRHIQQHAATLYVAALPALTGTSRQKATQRVAEVTEAGTPKPVAPAPAVPTPGAPETPKIAVRNLTRAPEAQSIIEAAGRDFPDSLKNLTQATLLYYRDGSQLSHGQGAQGGSRPLQGANSTSPSLSTGPNFLFASLSDPFKPGKYLVVYRVQLLKGNDAPNAFQTDVWFQGESQGRRFVKASEVPIGQWKAIPMLVSPTMPLNGEYRIYAGKNATVALDRVYVFAVQ